MRNERSVQDCALCWPPVSSLVLELLGLLALLLFYRQMHYMSFYDVIWGKKDVPRPQVSPADLA